MNKILYVVHCIDTEGPLKETMEATFARLAEIFGIHLEPTNENLIKLQNEAIDLGDKTHAVARCFAPELLEYNSNWDEIDLMLDDALSQDFRNRALDDFGNGWVYSWHCVDHFGYLENPREKDLGYGKIFNFYRNKLKQTNSAKDEINWHFHPLSINQNPLSAATSYANNYHNLLEILSRRLIENNWFPTVNRPGFHSERPDSHAFLEQWIPFDYANQYCDDNQDQPDVSNSRFGDWGRSSNSWRGYHPCHEDYQQSGGCNRVIFRCLNLGTRLRSMNEHHLKEAFLESQTTGSAVIAFADHDFRDIRKDVENFRSMLARTKLEFPDIKVKFSAAGRAAIEHLGLESKERIVLQSWLDKERLVIEVVSGEIFGPQPFLAILTSDGRYLHDNLDVLEPRRRWSYHFDAQTLSLSDVSKIAVGTAGKCGNSFVTTVEI
jgi:hypothetical protein